MLQPGLLRDNIIVQRKTVIKDTYGAETVIYSDHLYLRANADYKGGNKGINNEEIFSSRTIIFTTYFRDINETDLIIYDENEYKITFIAEIGYREGLSITTQLVNE